MSAVAAQSVGYTLIPGNGRHPYDISAGDAQSLLNKYQDNNDARADRLADLLVQRGMGDVSFRLAGSDVIIPRTSSDAAWTIHNLLDKLPHMVSSAANDDSNVISFPQERAHIGQAFAEAVNPLLKAPDMSEDFETASARPAAPARTVRRSFGMERHAA